MTTSVSIGGATQQPLAVFYDGNDLVAKIEANKLKEKDKAEHLKLVDVSQSGYKPADYNGVSLEKVGHGVYVRDPSGEEFTSYDALLYAYAAIGLGNWFKYNRLPGLDSGDTSHPGTELNHSKLVNNVDKLQAA
jgi:hypothetical protein